MPQGKGTYGSQVGRPSKKKYNKGGSVDPFSTRNPEGVPAEQAMDMLEDANMANKGIPTSNAQERNKTYQVGGEVLDYDESSIPDISLEPTAETPSIAEEYFAGAEEEKDIPDSNLSEEKGVRTRKGWLESMRKRGKMGEHMADIFSKKWGL